MLEELLENYIESEEINDSLKKHCNKVLKIIKYIYCNTPPKRISFVYE
jgi:actin-like ATPase involved in cell morphogenesis